MKSGISFSNLKSYNCQLNLNHSDIYETTHEIISKISTISISSNHFNNYYNEKRWRHLNKVYKRQ